MLAFIKKLISSYSCNHSHKDSLFEENMPNNSFHRYIRLIENNDMKYDHVQCAKKFIEIIIEYLNYEEAIQVIEKEHGAQKNSLVEQIYSQLEENVGLDPNITAIEKVDPDDEKCYKNVSLINRQPIQVPINELPILLDPWDENRILNNLIEIDEFDGVKHSRNIQNHYLHPMGIVVCNGGNHSQLSGRYKNKGTTTIRQIKDFTLLYEKVKFDGDNYIKTDDNTVIKMDYNKHILFYSGVIFELGRYLIKDRNYCIAEEICNIIEKKQ